MVLRCEFLLGFRVNCAKVVLECFDGIFSLVFCALYFDKRYFRLFYARLYSMNILVFTLRYSL